MNEVAVGLFDRALSRISSVWRDMALSVTGEEDISLEARMKACLDGRGGEVSARNRAAKLARDYEAADDNGRVAFLRTLATFDSDPAKVAGSRDIVAAFQKVKAVQAPFASRGDKSGTHFAEVELWKAAGIDVSKEKGWYRETG